MQGIPGIPPPKDLTDFVVGNVVEIPVEGRDCEPRLALVHEKGD